MKHEQVGRAGQVVVLVGDRERERDGEGEHVNCHAVLRRMVVCVRENSPKRDTSHGAGRESGDPHNRAHAVPWCCFATTHRINYHGFATLLLQHHRRHRLVINWSL